VSTRRAEASGERGFDAPPPRAGAGAGRSARATRGGAGWSGMVRMVPSGTHPPISCGLSALVLEADLELDLVLHDLAVLDPRARLHRPRSSGCCGPSWTPSRPPAARRRSTIAGSSRPSRG
jgi:hypothetical protein